MKDNKEVNKQILILIAHLIMFFAKGKIKK
jgi:hypothetical protein